MNLENVGVLTRAGVPIGKLAAGATISGVNAAHLTVTPDGTVTISVGGQGNLAGSYALEVAGNGSDGALVFSTEANTYDVGSSGAAGWAELKAAIGHASANRAVLESVVCIRNGLTVTPGWKEARDGSPSGNADGLSGYAFAGTVVNANAGLTRNANIDRTATASFVGGSVKITCRAKYGAKINATLGIRTNGIWVDGIDFTTFAPLTAIVPTAAILPATAQRGGSGYTANDTFQYDDGNGLTISGKLTVDGSGAITGGYITSRAANADDFVGPVSLTNSTSGNGIRSTTGSGGYLWLCGDNYSKGPPLATTETLRTTANCKQILIQPTVTASVANLVDVIISNCRFGSSTSMGTRPGRWMNTILNRGGKNVVIEDCEFDSFTSGPATRLVVELHIRRCSFKNIAGDVTTYYMADTVPNDWPSGQFARIVEHDNTSFAFDVSGMWSSVHSDGAQIGSELDQSDVLFYGNRNYRVLAPLADDQMSAQGYFTHDTARVVGGELSENLVLVNCTHQACGFRSPPAGDGNRLNIHHNTFLNLFGSNQTGSGTEIGKGGTITIYYGDGPIVRDNIVAAVWDATVAPGVGPTITKGAGYAVNEEFWFAENKAHYKGRGKITSVDANGGITGVSVVEGNVYGAATLQNANGINSMTGAAGRITIPGNGGPAVVNNWGTSYKTGDTYWARASDGTIITGVITAFAGGGRIASVTTVGANNTGTAIVLQHNSPTANGTGIRSVSGTGGRLVWAAGPGTGWNGKSNPGTQPLNQGGGMTAEVVGNVYTQARIANTGAGTSFPELFVGPFGGFTPARGWQVAYGRATAAQLRADIDAIFKPKPGASTVEKGHLAYRLLPENPTGIKILGSVYVGNTLTVDEGTWHYVTGGTTYKWYKDGVVISGAAGGSYVVTLADEGSTITVEVSKFNFAGLVVATAEKRNWIPRDLGAALIAWYDAKDVGRLTIVGGKVAVFADKSGNGYHLGQSNASRRPVYSATGLDGSRPGLSYASSVTCELVRNIAPIPPVRAVSGITVAAVANFTSLTANRMYTNFIAGSSALPNTRIGFGLQNTGALLGAGRRLQNDALAQVTSSTLSPALGSNVFIAGKFDYANAKLSLRMNGTADNNLPFLTAGNSNATDSRGIIIGGNSDTISAGGSPINGNMGENLFILGAVSEATMDVIDGYLAHRWGLTSLLPSGHVYKNEAPTV